MVVPRVWRVDFVLIPVAIRVMRVVRVVFVLPRPQKESVRRVLNATRVSTFYPRHGCQVNTMLKPIVLPVKPVQNGKMQPHCVTFVTMGSTKIKWEKVVAMNARSTRIFRTARHQPHFTTTKTIVWCAKSYNSQKQQHLHRAKLVPLDFGQAPQTTKWHANRATLGSFNQIWAKHRAKTARRGIRRK